MTRSFHIDIEIDESKLDDDTKATVDNELGKKWIEKAIEDALENENIEADVFAQDVKPD